MQRYVALRLALNLDVLGRIDDRDALRLIAEREQERECALTAPLVASLLED